MQAIVNDVTRTVAGSLTTALDRLHPALVRLLAGLDQAQSALNRMHPARLRALVLAVLIVCLGAAPISLAGSGDQQAASAVVSAVGDSRGAAPAPVAGLSRTQMDHARTIVRVGQQMNLPERAYVIAVATSMQETNLRNLANTGVPASLHKANDGVGYDHDSVGLFQQRPASGWGSPDELMDPATSARKFYQALQDVPGWQHLPLTVAAQEVQGSAFPDAYAKHQDEAEAVVAALTK
jgi:hypothetical protein